MVIGGSELELWWEEDFLELFLLLDELDFFLLFFNKLKKVIILYVILCINKRERERVVI